ncbi:hypothetical protein ANCCAN_28857 [Ancylostoma caninum]|uniref:Uncharacterized protein n=1 Tax=Ancylostoma caninum TaxID=29170 RepID=A0A368F344_ANCCA|nr:hypothetical protein ANCCAN_28857 [Ancylostoma caninum]
MRRDELSVPPFHEKDPRFFQQQIADCEPTYQSMSCEGDNQWAAGISPLLNVSAFPMALQCCSFEPLRLSSDRGIAIVARNGSQYAFDYISNIAKTIGHDGSVTYEVYVRRFVCLPPVAPKKQHMIVGSPMVYNAQEFRRAPQHNRAFQVCS